MQSFYFTLLSGDSVAARFSNPHSMTFRVLSIIALLLITNNIDMYIKYIIKLPGGQILSKIVLFKKIN